MVSEVLNIKRSVLEDTKMNGEVRILLDINRVLSAENIEMITVA